MGILRRLTLNAIAFARGRTLSYLRELRSSEQLDAEQARKLQQDRLRSLLSHARDHVPYYRKLSATHEFFDHSGAMSFDRLHGLPLLTKEILRARFDELLSDDLGSRRWSENTSGGSTGEPVRFVRDQACHEWFLALAGFYDLWTGYRPGDRKALLWGSERDLFVGRETFRQRLGWFLHNIVRLNAFRMTRENMRGYVDAINAQQPRQILAYASSLYELSQYIEREGISVGAPQAVMVSAGTLFQEMRETIRRVFRAPVFNRYGSREVGDIASECEHHEGLHVCPATHYVEILRENGEAALPGETGEVVVTLLVNHAMPLIRFRIGDMAAWSEKPCSCGRSWPLLMHVAGRVTDTFVSPDGTRIDGEYFTHLFYFRNWIERFQVVQEDYRHVRLLIVPLDLDGDPASRHSADLDDIIGKIRIVMGEDCRVTTEFLPAIPALASGKYRYTISKCSDARREPART
jgi:phenylacetate-CoA ligase